ncbi:hypothetical protein OG21DRAFT_1524998 [Imleria badia]|nr:hypothetical protein OG21DRAFT_1524998 [Imleria badia]
MVMELQAKEQNAAAPDVQVKAPSSKRKSSSSNKRSGNGAVEQGDKPMPSDVQAAATASTKPKRATKASLKSMISGASKAIASDVFGNGVRPPAPRLDKPGDPNLSQYLKKKSLSGTIKGWSTLVHEKTLLKHSPPAVTTTSVSAFGAPSSLATKVPDTLATTTTQYSVTDAGVTTKFRSFELDSKDDDDDKEKEAMPFKMNDNVALVVPSAADSDSEIEPSQIPPWYSPRIPFNDVEFKASQMPPWYSPRIPSTPNNDAEFEASQIPPSPHIPSAARKRKMEDVQDSNREGAESDMQIDTDITHKIRTTTSSTSHQTSVSVTMEDTQPVVKKAKIEAGKETQAETRTTTASVDAAESKTTRTAGTETKSHSEYKNSDLPIPADHRWTNAFMDTAILWAGGQANIWSIPDETLVAALQKIFTAVYPNVQYKRLLEWRSGFGSTALVMVIHFFWEIIKDNVKSEDSKAMAREIARQLISPPHFPFTHEDCDDLDPACNFHSDFILKLIATAHLGKIASAVDIQSLEMAKLQKGYGMECIVALAAAALERAFTLVRDGVIDIQNAVKEMANNKGKVKLPKTLNKATRNMSKGTSMFSMSNWGSETQSYAISVTKKGPENTADIIFSAYASLDRGPTNSSPSDADTVDPRALLWYYFQTLGPH